MIFENHIFYNIYISAGHESFADVKIVIISPDDNCRFR
jgi:hypothetical protein